jgi:hypothetical protein
MMPSALLSASFHDSNSILTALPSDARSLPVYHHLRDVYEDHHLADQQYANASQRFGARFFFLMITIQG